jgi:hypothetical protein
MLANGIPSLTLPELSLFSSENTLGFICCIAVMNELIFSPQKLFIFNNIPANSNNYLGTLPFLGAKKALFRKLAAISGPLALRPHLSEGLPLSINSF